ncbi:MAG TPA: FIST N-terminal domain-containing protein [Mycobacteriales bacterium]|nr:FIST N-terminal domain-containing protein [Mycobacteriales bacterium]
MAGSAVAQATGGAVPALIVVFVSSALDLAEIAAGLRESCGDVPVVGCSTAGEIALDGPGDEGIVVLALGGTGFTVATAAATGASKRLRDAGAEAAACFRQIGDCEHAVLLLLTDGLAGDQQEIVRGVYGVVGAEVPLVGGCAGDDLRMVRTQVLHNDRFLDDAVVAVAIGSTGPFGIGVQHGWRTVGEPMLVTASSGNRVFALDDQPALDVYLRRLDAPEAAHHDAAAFTRFALTHPLGLTRRSGQEVRFIADADFTERSLGCIARVPQGGMTWIMEGDDESVLRATEAACDDALEQLAGAAPLGLLAFDCIARRAVLGEPGIAREIAIVGDRAGGVPVAGFYTYGEIARTRGTGGFHNQTLVVLAVG